jgi:poly-beta-1,6-N-acetyl-D-glucosamine synthase
MQSLGSLELIILLVFGVVTLIQLFYYLFFYLKIGFPIQYPQPASQPPVSIVICARDEEENLRNNLPLILEQDYPDFEVVLVDDCSSDNTEFLLKEFTARYSHFRYTRIHQDDKFMHGKKLALTVGIKSAKNEWLLLTDADCKPAGRNWLSGMASHFSDNVGVVLGYGGFELGKGLLNLLIRYDAFFIAIQYLSFAMRGIPYMGVGRNLAYRKQLFFENRGFASHNHLASGDDDLFIREVATRKNTQTEFTKACHTRTRAKESFRHWILQKKRHLTTSNHYNTGVKILLGLEPLSRSLFYILFIIAISMQLFPEYIAGLFLLRWILQLIVLRIASKRLKEKYLLLPSLLFDLFLPFFYLGMFFANLFNRKKYQWS